MAVPELPAPSHIPATTITAAVCMLLHTMQDGLEWVEWVPRKSEKLLLEPPEHEVITAYSGKCHCEF